MRKLSFSRAIGTPSQRVQQYSRNFNGRFGKGKQADSDSLPCKFFGSKDRHQQYKYVLPQETVCTQFLMGDFLAVISAVGYAGVLVWTKMTRRANLPILGTLFFAWTIAAVALIVICLLFGSMQISMNALLWTIGLAIVCTNIPFYLLNKGMQHHLRCIHIHLVQ